MSWDDKILLPHLLITEIIGDRIKIDFDSVNTDDQETISKLFDEIRYKYFEGQSQSNGLYLPLRLKRDQLSGEILQKGHLLFLKNKSTSKYFLKSNSSDFQKKLSFNEVNDLQKGGNLKIKAYIDLYYIEQYDRIFVNANITEALLWNSPHDPFFSEEFE